MPKKQNQPTPVSILDFFSIPDPDAKRNQPAKGNDNGQNDLAAQITAMNARLDQMAAANGNPQVVVQAVQPQDIQEKPPELDMKGLPDPLEDVEKYNLELGKRISAHNQATAQFYQKQVQASTNQQSETERKMEALWNDFAAQNKDFVKVPKKQLEFAAIEAIEAAQQRGIDTQTYIFRNKQQFFNDVKLRFKETFGDRALEDENADTNEQDQPAQPQQRAPALETDDNEPVNRATGINSSNPGGPRPAQAAKPGDMLKDLGDLQRVSGFF